MTPTLLEPRLTQPDPLGRGMHKPVGERADQTGLASRAQDATASAAVDGAVVDDRVAGVVEGVVDSWVRAEFAVIVAANWPAQERPAPARRRPRVRTLAPPERRPGAPAGWWHGVGERAGPAASRVLPWPRERSPPALGSAPASARPDAGRW